MRLCLLIGLLLVLPGCVSPVNTPQSPGSGTATPSTSVTARPVALAPCRLPFLGETTSPFGPGFVGYPTGTFTPDSSGALHGLPDGSGAETYDWRFARWVPVGHDLVSPDASQYAYSEAMPNPASQGLGGPAPLGTRVHLVDVAGGTNTVVYESHDQLNAVSFRSEGIYLTQPISLADTATAFHLWLLDPKLGSAQRLLGGKTVGPGSPFITTDSLWITAYDPGNPGLIRMANQLLRLSLVDGSQTVWFERPHVSVDLLGVDRLGHPVVSTFADTAGHPGKTWLIAASDTPKLVADQGFTGPAIADSHGLWLAGDGVFLYPTGGPIRKVSTELGALLGACG